MTDLNELATRVARLEARTEIADLVTRYGVSCDEKDIDHLRSLFTRDAVFDSPSGVMCAKGRDAIIDMFCEVLAVRGPGYHWTHDHIIRFDQGSETRASGRVFSHAETTPGGTHSFAAMKYDDLYRVEDGAWRFASRVIHFFYYVPAAEYHGVLTQTHRVVFGDSRLPADYPEALSGWKEFDAKYANGK